MKNRTIFISFEAPPYGGGAGVYFNSLVNELSGSVDFATHRRSSHSIERHKCNFFYFPPKLWFLFTAPLLAFLGLFYARLILNDPPFIYGAGLLPKCILSKVCIIVHGRERRLDSPNFIDKIIFFPYAYSRAINKSFKVIFVSDYIRGVFEREYKISANARVLHNAVPKVRGEYEKHSINYESQSSYRLVTVCRLVKGKGLVDTFRDIKSLIKNNNVVWDIYGSGPEFTVLKKMILEEHLSEKITMHGKVPTNYIFDAYRKADCFILNSKLEESFGLVFLEAASCGCMVIANDSFGTKEALLYVKNWRDYKSERIIDDLLFLMNTRGSKRNECFRYIDDLISDLYNQDIIL